jgi:hypothetical protein
MSLKRNPGPAINVLNDTVVPAGKRNPGPGMQVSGAGMTPEEKQLLNDIAANEFKVFYYSEINSNTGTIVIPENTEIVTDQFPGGIDALVNTIENNFPSGENPQTSSGTVVDVSNFDTLGNYTLDGVPVHYPVALIYVLKVTNQYWKSIDADHIISSTGKYVLSNYVNEIVKLTQAEYNALEAPSPTTLYVITII